MQTFQTELAQLTRATTLISKHRCIYIMHGWCFLIWANISYFIQQNLLLLSNHVQQFVYSTNILEMDCHSISIFFKDNSRNRIVFYY